jgi:hypothetical protein
VNEERVSAIMAFSGEKLQDTARDTARALPGVSHGRPFTETLDVYKVAGKVFLIVLRPTKVIAYGGVTA